MLADGFETLLPEFAQKCLDLAEKMDNGDVTISVLDLTEDGLTDIVLVPAWKEGPEVKKMTLDGEVWCAVLSFEGSQL